MAGDQVNRVIKSGFSARHYLPKPAFLMSAVRARWAKYMAAPAIDTKVANQVVAVFFFQ